MIEKIYKDAFRPKPVHYLNGYRVRRPWKDHPNPEHWAELRKQRWQLQNGQCGTCPENGSNYPLELHHRHYGDGKGNERIEDVILLCRPCHQAITSKDRDARYAAGEWKVPPHTRLQVGDEFTRFKAKDRVIEVSPTYEITTPRFKPPSRY